jgi:CheY-like chemotaxis protein
MSALLRVAVADDERDIRQFLVQVVRRMGHEVVCAASSGKELLEQCLDQPPDLVISDVRMPELSGEEVAEMLQQRGPIPVILITAQPQAASLPQVGAAPRLILTKPLSSQELASAVQQVLSARQACARQTSPPASNQSPSQTPSV